MKKRNLFRASLYLILAIIFFIIAQIYYFINKGTLKSEGDAIESFQKLFLSKEQVLTEKISELQTKDFTTLEIDSFIVNSELNKDEYLLIIYKNNDLFFWSDNSISIPDKYLPEFFNGRVIAKTPYLFYKKEVVKDQFRYIGLIKIQNIAQGDKAVKKTYSKGFEVIGNSTLELTKQKNNIHDADGNFIFSVNYNNLNEITVEQSIFIIFLYLFIFAFIIISILALISSSPKILKRPNLIFLGMSLVILLVRYLCFTFEIPYNLFDSKLFSPENTVQGLLGPQPIGQLLIDAYLFIILSVIFFKYFGFRFNKMARNKVITFCLLIIGISIVTAAFYIIVTISSHLIVDTNYLIDPNKLIYFNAYSLLVILIIFGFIFGFSAFANRICKIVYVFLNKDYKKITIIFGISFIISILFNIFCIPSIQLLSSWIILLALYIYFIFNILSFYQNKSFFDFFTFFFNVIFFAAFLSVITSTYLEKREADFRSQFSSILASNQKKMEGDELSKILASIDFNSYATNQKSKIDSIDKQLNRSIIENYSDITSQYSFAYFVDNKLIDQYGSYYYSLDLDYYTNLQDIQKPVNLRNYEHFVYKINKAGNEVIVISKRKDAAFSKTSAFSFFAISLFLFYSTLLILVGRFSKVKHKKMSLRSRIQWSFFMVILTIGFFTCVISINFFTRTYYAKNYSFISEKMQSIQFLFAGEENFPQSDLATEGENAHSLNRLLELSHIYSSDILLFDKSGMLLVTSTPELITQGYTGNIMNRTAMTEIIEKKRTLLVQEEFIGSQKITSAYKPIFNKNDEITEVINLLFIGDKTDFRLETSSFISNFLSFYFFLILFAILFSWIIYIYVSKPLYSLGKIISRNKNEKIKIRWEHNDEIGELIQEHNRMVEELRENAELLARSERESAWREMAKQVAHEIKNPLTPMKLNIQMLQKSWEDKKDDFASRFDKVSANLLLQIEVLSEIASTFSEFANTQNAVNTKEDIILLLNEMQESLQDPEIELNFHYNQDKECFALIEKNQFKRMFQYLIRNAKEHEKEDEKPEIDFFFFDYSEKYWLLTVKDNGKGMAPELISSVFNFNFTTKTNGTSLGLPIVKNIVSGFNGEITFSTETDNGTQFNIYIPKIQ